MMYTISKALSGEARSTITYFWTIITSKVCARTAMARYMPDSRDTHPRRRCLKHSMNYLQSFTEMKIGDIITKYYKEFHSMVRNADVAVENGNTMEDVFQNAMMTALKKFPGEVDETEGYDYIKKTLLTEFYFSYKRKKRDILLFSDANFEGIPA